MQGMNEPDKSDREQGDATEPTSQRAGQRSARYLWEMEQARRRAVRDIVEQRIEEARAEGKFDNLSGAGKPLPRDDSDVWAGDRALAFHLLKSNDVAPPELERGHEIDTDLERAEESVRALRHHRDTLAARQAVFASDRRAYNIQRDATERRYEEALRAINSKILSLNITAPAVFHRRLIPVERRMEVFRAEFPRLPE
jgi:DnaJ family protein C protein 28